MVGGETDVGAMPSRMVLPVSELHVGMVLAEDLRTSSGMKLLARGTALTRPPPDARVVRTPGRDVPFPIEQVTHASAPPELLVLANRHAVYGRAARWLIHDLRNPAQALSLITELMDDEPEAGDPDAAETIREATSHLGQTLEMLDRLLRLTPPAAEPAPLSVTDSLRFVAALHRLNRTGVVLDLSGEPNAEPWASLPAVRGVEQDLEQILLNLLLNALAAVGQEGSGRIAIRASADGDGVHIAVSDTGPGVPPEMLDRLFQPFVSGGESSGTAGLGLAVSRYLAERAGGRLEHVPQVGRGAEFCLTLERWGQARPA